MAERRLHNSGQNRDHNVLPAAIRNSNMSEEGIILLEEFDPQQPCSGERK